LNDEIKKNNNIYKRVDNKIKNQNIEDQIRKYSTINLDWRIKLKTNKILQKGQGKKLEIKRLRTKLKNIIFDKLRLKYKIENK
jgi:hypothetical protein